MPLADFHFKRGHTHGLLESDRVEKKTKKAKHPRQTESFTMSGWWT